ncbi:MAG: tetratricopeptide (TPR) repeat protein, partial [Myxococcota bacterium]
MGRELRVGAQRVDLGSGRLSGGGVLGAKQTALLGLLVDAAPHPVATARLVDALWPEGLPPGSRALSMLWSALRRKLAPDDGVLQTFRGRGYAFVGPVRFVAPGADLPGLADPGPFIGREAEIQQILDFAGGAGGWLTVTGMGGTGKTRLAAEAALRLRRGGVAAVWVDLAPQASVSGGLGAVARALGVVPGPGVDPAAAVCAALRGLDGVLVLDNMEHLLGVAPAVVDAARWANGVRVLATSRRVLGVPGEAVVRLDGLPHSGAMDLFEALALGAAPGGHYDAAAVGQLCTLLHGHPLSLELAAATLRRRPLTRLLHTLAAGRELPGESVGRPARQGSLAATFDYSWALLPGGLQRALTALSLFAGPFDAATALGSAAVAVEPIRALERHSLVGRRADDRWGLHPLVRAFAAARLPIDADARVGHRRWFLGIAGRLPAALRADDDPTLEAAITRALPDLGAAWKAAVDAGDSEAVALGWPGLEAWAVDVGHVSVGETWLATGRPLLDRPDTPVSVRTGLRRLAATTLAEAGHPAEAIAEVEAALPLAPSVSARSRLLCARAVAEWTGGDSDAASATIDTAIGLAEAEGTPEDLATALLTQSRHHAARMRGNLNVEVCQRAVRLLSDTQDHRLLRHARETLFTVQRTGSWLDEAEALGPELLAAARLRGDTAAIANVAVGMAWLRRSQGALTDALDLAAEAAEADAACGRSMAVPLALAVQASVLLELGRLDEADAVLARASALTEP